MTTEEIVKHLRTLPPEEQAGLVDQFLVEVAQDGFHESVAGEWTEEIRRRVELSRSGQLEGQPWEVVRDDLKRRLADSQDDLASS